MQLLDAPFWVIDRDRDVHAEYATGEEALDAVDQRNEDTPMVAPFQAVRVVPLTREHPGLPAEAFLKALETEAGFSGPTIPILHAEARKAIAWVKDQLERQLRRLRP